MKVKKIIEAEKKFNELQSKIKNVEDFLLNLIEDEPKKAVKGTLTGNIDSHIGVWNGTIVDSSAPLRIESKGIVLCGEFLDELKVVIDKHLTFKLKQLKEEQESLTV